MKQLLLLAAIFSTVLITGCHKEKEIEKSSCVLLNSDDYLIFGTTFGFCAGNCTQLFKLTTSQLFEDDNEYFVRGEVVKFKSQPLSNAKLAMAEELCKTFPYDKIKSEAETLGCPDCHDQGLIYFELKKNGVVKKWYVDPDANQNQVPDYLKTYVQIVRTTVDKLK